MDKPASALTLFVRGLLNPAFPALIFLVFLGIALVLQYGIEKQDHTQIQSNLGSEASSMAKRLEREFRVHANSISRMAKRFEALPDTPKEIWEQDARRYLSDFGVYQAIEWIDRDYVIRWMVPIEGNEDAIGFNVAFSPERRTSLQKAQMTGDLDISGVIDLKQGGKGMVIYAPISTGDANNCFIAGVFQIGRASCRERV